MQHLRFKDLSHASFDVKVAVHIERDGKRQKLCTSNLRYLYWTPYQQISHHASADCGPFFLRRQRMLLSRLRWRVVESWDILRTAILLCCRRGVRFRAGGGCLGLESVMERLWRRSQPAQPFQASKIGVNAKRHLCQTVNCSRGDFPVRHIQAGSTAAIAVTSTDSGDCSHSQRLTTTVTSQGSYKRHVQTCL